MGAAVAERLLVLVPYAGSALLTGLTPARAVLCSWLLEGGLPQREPAAAFLLRHGGAWLLLHFLRPDAPWLAGASFLLLAAVTRPAWGRRAGARAALLGVLLVAPALLALAPLAGREPSAALAWLDPWKLAARRPLPAAALPAPSLPPGAELAPPLLRLPERLQPHPLEGSFQLRRAWVLLAALLLLNGVAAAAPGRLAARLLLPGLALAVAGGFLARQPSGVRFYFEEDGAEGRRWRLVEVHRAGAGLWDPLRGPLLPPSGPYKLVAERQNGLVRVVSATPWGVLRPAVEAPPPEEVMSWLEAEPLRGVHSGGPLADRGGRALLALWLAGETAGAAVRWEVGPTGTLCRRLLP